MINTKAFIHLFKTRKRYYVYDVNTDVFLSIPHDTFVNLHHYLNSDIELSEAAGEDRIVNELIDKGFLSSRRIEEIVHPLDNMITYFLDNSMRMLTLQITQQCNLRCSYCAYSGSYLNRSHSAKMMSIEVAKKGIDFLIKHSKDSQEVSVSFYGGEPLLRFDFIKECVLYAEEKGEGKNITFNMTTNGTLLNEEILNFMDLHKIHTTISLDGPKEIHDINRKFSNGVGSFDKIMKNIKLIKVKYPEYLATCVNFNIVLDGENDFSCINNFFMSYDIVKDLLVNASNINPLYTDEKSEPSEEFINKINYERFKVLLSKLGKLDKENTSRLLNTEFLRLAETFNELRKPQQQVPNKAHHSGPCVPGVNRFFVSTDGIFYPCERVSEESLMMRIGDIDNGFDIDKVRNLLNVGKLTENKCKNCWAFRYCYMCAAYADEMTELSKTKKASYCNEIKGTIEQKFITYCTMNEFGYDFDKVSDYEPEKILSQEEG